MAATDNPLLQYESGQQYQPWEKMGDTGDHQVFEASFAPWSGRAGFDVRVIPYGLATGGQITPHTDNDKVSVAALTAMLPGSAAANADGQVVLAAEELDIARATTDTHKITSIIVSDSGDLQALAGLQGTSFSEVRGAAGAPPYIPEKAVEIGQVRLSSSDSGVIESVEIFQVVGVHQERYDHPVWQLDHAAGEVHFASPLPAIHTGGKPKATYVSGYTPIFAEIPRCVDFVPAEESHSVNSTEIYGGTLGSVSRSLGQASFTHYGDNGITDPIVQAKNQNLWFRWQQDRNRAPYSLTQGILGISRTNPAGQNVVVSCTISASQATQDYEG